MGGCVAGGVRFWRRRIRLEEKVGDWEGIEVGGE